MNGVMTLMAWYEMPWWVGLKEVLILLGFVLGMISGTIGVVTYHRNTAIRAQDVQANRIRRTYELMVSYPGIVREKVLTVTKQLDEGVTVIEALRQQGIDENHFRNRLNQFIAYAGSLWIFVRSPRLFIY